ncbi:ADPRH-like protein [Mya arenaria]|uniref:ADP-ribosylhydrolase ARH1 n=1 Tax=Mya arenaria TaxID=6604 RepID=A0ABY7FCV2_MYAAR|nr:ADPRH-like protein [Mya arenaria]
MKHHSGLKMVSLQERYVASMVLSGTGDALGYKNGNWEFCHSGEEIHRELGKLGGLEKIQVNTKNWMVSDDTVMHLATAEGLVTGKSGDNLFLEIAALYKGCFKDMAGRAPGAMCGDSVRLLKPHREKGYRIPFNPRGGGCGAAMRAMCIGLLYPRHEDIHKLIEVSVESGRMTHNHPTGYLGALASALFTAYSVQSKPIKEWGKGLVDTLPDAWKYVEKTDRWVEYLKTRNIEDGTSEPTFPEKYGIRERDAFYKSLSISGWGGSSGHDAPMIAYDALLSYNGTWNDLCNRAMFHGGDNDSTGVIAGACYGAMFGFKGVPKGNYSELEYKERLERLAKYLLKLSHPEDYSDFPVSDDKGCTENDLPDLKLLNDEKRREALIPKQKTRMFKTQQGKKRELVHRSQGKHRHGVRLLKPQRDKGYRIPFRLQSRGCGAVMRAMCIGLLYHRPEDIHKLVEVSVESGRMTHNHPTGYLGALASALFTAYSVHLKPIKEWGKGLVDTIPAAWKYVKDTGVDVEQNKEHWDYFTDRWKYGIRERDAFYKSLSFSGFGRASGHDAPMIAYDALLSYNGTWNDLCSRAMFHGGDSDSTGVIAGACYGAMFGYRGVPEGNYRELEYKERLERLLKLSHTEDVSIEKYFSDLEPFSDIIPCPAIHQGDQVTKEGDSGTKRKSEDDETTTGKEKGDSPQKPGEI